MYLLIMLVFLAVVALIVIAIVRKPRLSDDKIIEHSVTVAKQQLTAYQTLKEKSPGREPMELYVELLKMSRDLDERSTNEIIRGAKRGNNSLSLRTVIQGLVVFECIYQSRFGTVPPTQYGKIAALVRQGVDSVIPPEL